MDRDINGDEEVVDASQIEHMVAQGGQYIETAKRVLVAIDKTVGVDKALIGVGAVALLAGVVITAAGSQTKRKS